MVLTLLVSLGLLLRSRARSRGPARSADVWGFPAGELEQIADRLSEVEREFERNRLSEVLAQLDVTQSRLAAIRPVEAASRSRGAATLVRVVLLFEGSLEVSGVVEAGQVAQFMPWVRSGHVPRVRGAMMSDSTVELLFSVDGPGASSAMQLRLVDPRLGV